MASTVLPNGIIIPEKYSRDWYNDLYHNWQELDNLLGGGTPKDGTLTIQKNGDTVGTFSANQSTNETINIEVPTKTSDLTNDSDFVQSSDLATVATSGSYNDLSNKPTIPTVNNATLTIQKNGTNVQTFTANQSTNATANITVPTKTSDLTNDSGFITSDDTKIPLAGSSAISGSLIPSTDGTVNLGGPSYQWNNAYIKSLTINGVVCGNILTHNVSEFVKVTGDQTVAGVKTFSSNVIIQGSRKVTCNLDNSFIELDGGTTWGKGGSILLSGQDRSSYTNSVLIVSKSDTNTDILQYQNGELKPLSNNTNDSSLGTSTNKWKSLNGINPGALSLPSTSYTTLDVTNFVLDGDTNNRIVMPYDGWLNIRMTSCEKYSVRNTLNGITYQVENASGLVHLTIPVPSGTNMAIYAKCSSIDLRAFTCQGNV